MVLGFSNVRHVYPLVYFSPEKSLNIAMKRAMTDLNGNGNHKEI